MIAIVGRLQTRDWEDKDGNKRRSVEIVAENCYFAGGKKEENGGAKLEELPDDIDGELPFTLGEDEELPL
jgi:single-strand DNA-binding protein